MEWAPNMQQPALASLAFSEIADPDYTHVSVDVLPAHADADPAAWARSLASPDVLPPWLRRAIRTGDLFRRSSGQTCLRQRLAVRAIVGDEALIGLDSPAWDLRIGVGVDECQSLVRVIATVRFKSPHAAALSWPVRAVAPFIVRGMLARSRRAMSGVTR